MGHHGVHQGRRKAGAAITNLYSDSEYQQRLVEAMRYGVINVKNGYSDDIQREAYWWAEQWGLGFDDVAHILRRALEIGIAVLAQDLAQERIYSATYLSDLYESPRSANDS